MRLRLYFNQGIQKCFNDLLSDVAQAPVGAPGG